VDKGNKGYHKLIVWQKLRDLLLITYKLIDKLPKSEEFGLKSQMRRAIVSVLSNFIEGYLKRSTKEKLHFLEIAETSLLELEAQSEICSILNFWNIEDTKIFEEKRGLAAYFPHQYKSKLSP
jgi:four helix bundle protein